MVPTTANITPASAATGDDDDRRDDQEIRGPVIGEQGPARRPGDLDPASVMSRTTPV
jgi:hypothetical protein